MTDNIPCPINERWLSSVSAFLLGGLVVALSFSASRFIMDATVLEVRLLAALLGILVAVPLVAANLVLQMAIRAVWRRKLQKRFHLPQGLVLITPAAAFAVWQVASATCVATSKGGFVRFVNRSVPSSVQEIKHGGYATPFGGVWVVRFKIERDDLCQLIADLQLSRSEGITRNWLSSLCSSLEITCDLSEENEAFEATRNGWRKVVFRSSNSSVAFVVTTLLTEVHILQSATSIIADETNRFKRVRS